MLITEMHVALDQEIDRISSDNKPDLNPAEKDMYLQKAIWIFLKQRYDIDNRRQEGFETNQERIDSLRTLHVESPNLQPEITPTSIGNGIYRVQLSQLDYEYLFLTEVEARIVKNNCEKKVDAKPLQTDDRETKYSKPSFKWSRVNTSLSKSTSTTNLNPEEKGALYLDTNDEFTIAGVCISYLKYPNRVFFSGYDHIDGNSVASDAQIHCDIDAAFHPEIVRLAALEVMGDLGDPNFNAKRYRVETDQI